MKIMTNNGKVFCKILLLFVLLMAVGIYASEKSAKSFSSTPWSVRMADSEIKRRPVYNSYVWDYVTGTFLKSIEELWRTTNNTGYFQYIRNNIDGSISSSGAMFDYNMSIYSLDNICEGRLLLLMLKEGQTAVKYQLAINQLREQLRNQPRVAEGGFWHRNNVASNAYPHQMWLDGVYMANPFYAEYGKLYNEPSIFDDVITQITVMENHARDAATGLLYHGWDESKSQAWANSITGCSPSFWGRAVGWYAMAVVDILDYLPQEHSGRAKAIAILQRLAEAIKKVQDTKSGTWYQVLDKGSLSDNYRESSASCDFVYTLAKAVRLGYIDKSYLDVAKAGYTGILNEFVETNADSSINLTKTCLTAGLGGSNPYRDGTYNYYIYQTTISKNDGKATGPFILASLEMEKIGFIIPPQNLKVQAISAASMKLTWENKAYNAEGFIIQKRNTSTGNYEEIARLPRSILSYVDGNINPGNISYRVIAYNSVEISEPSNVVEITTNVINENKSINSIFELFQNYPNPFNPSTNINFTLVSGGYVNLSVFDLLGRKISTLVDEYKSAGSYEVKFDAEITRGLSLTNGMYFYRLSSGNFLQTRKMVLLK